MPARRLTDFSPQLIEERARFPAPELHGHPGVRSGRSSVAQAELGQGKIESEPAAQSRDRALLSRPSRSRRLPRHAVRPCRKESRDSAAPPPGPAQARSPSCNRERHPGCARARRRPGRDCNGRRPSLARSQYKPGNRRLRRRNGRAGSCTGRGRSWARNPAASSRATAGMPGRPLRLVRCGGCSARARSAPRPSSVGDLSLRRSCCSGAVCEIVATRIQGEARARRAFRPRPAAGGRPFARQRARSADA